MRRSGKIQLITGAALMGLAFLPVYSQPSLSAGRSIISDDPKAPSQVLDLSKNVFTDTSFASSGSFPHRVIFGPHKFPSLKYISVLGYDRSSPRIAVAASISGTGTGDYFDVTDDEPRSIPVSFILDRHPRIWRGFRLSMHRQTQYLGDRLAVPISFALNIRFKDKNNVKHHIILMKAGSGNYVRDNFANLVPEFGCITYPSIFDLWWDNTKIRAIFVLPSSRYNGDEIFVIPKTARAAAHIQRSTTLS